MVRILQPAYSYAAPVDEVAMVRRRQETLENVKKWGW